jgi:hypothetical protein
MMMGRTLPPEPIEGAPTMTPPSGTMSALSCGVVLGRVVQPDVSKQPFRREPPL